MNDLHQKLDAGTGGSIEALIARITNYLGNGGLFNPELMEHDKVRALLIEIRSALLLLRDSQPALVESLRAYGNQESTSALTRKDREQYQFWAGWLSALDKMAAMTHKFDPQVDEIRHRAKRTDIFRTALRLEAENNELRAALKEAQQQIARRDKAIEAALDEHEATRVLKFRIEELKAALDQSRQQTQWRDIETAPKDEFRNSTVLLWNRSMGAVTGYWGGEHWMMWGSWSRIDVTHWMPLPAPVGVAQETQP